MPTPRGTGRGKKTLSIPFLIHRPRADRPRRGGDGGNLTLSHEVTPFHCVRAVGWGGESIIEELKLFLEPLHVGILFFGDVENQVARPIEWLKVAFNSGEFIRFGSLVGCDRDDEFPFDGLLQEKRLEHLLVEGIL